MQVLSSRAVVTERIFRLRLFDKEKSMENVRLLVRLVMVFGMSLTVSLAVWAIAIDEKRVPATKRLIYGFIGHALIIGLLTFYFYLVASHYQFNNWEIVAAWATTVGILGSLVMTIRAVDQLSGKDCNVIYLPMALLAMLAVLMEVAAIMVLPVLVLAVRGGYKWGTP